MILLYFVLWILLSGEITLEVCISGAIVSILLHYFTKKIFGRGSKLEQSYLRRLVGSLRYLAYLFLEILKAGLVVMKLVYTKGKDTEPILVYFRTHLKTEEAKVALANSITLTAGTITVSTENDHFCVHALDRSLADQIENSEFARRLAELER